MLSKRLIFFIFFIFFIISASLDSRQNFDLTNNNNESIFYKAPPYPLSFSIFFFFIAVFPRFKQ